MLIKYKLLFNGRLGCYPHKKFHIDIEPGAKPVFQNAYKVPYRHEGAYKRELIAMLKDGTIKKCDQSKWASPTFTIPKENQTVRWINDFWELNKVIVQRSFPLPRIQDVMNHCGRYKYFTKIDLSMMFHCFELNEESKKLCTFNAPFGFKDCQWE